MLKQVLCTMILASMAGCSASTKPQPAAFGAGAQTPNNSDRRNDVSLAAIVDRDNSSINLYNFSDQPLIGGNIWINHTYVQRFDSIPARGHLALSRAKFYDLQGQSLTSVDTPTQTVQLQQDNNLFNLLGPVYQ